MADERDEEEKSQMVSGIPSSLLHGLPQLSTPSANSGAVPAASAVSQATPQARDSIELSAVAVSALQPPEQVFREAAAGDAHAIALIREEQTPIPHSLDLLA